MILLPTRGRRELLVEFFAQSAPVEPGRVLVDEDDLETYRGVWLPAGWDWFVGPRAPLVAICNRLFAAYPNEPWYGIAGDDMRYSTPGWDRALAAAACPKFVAWGDDGVQGAKLCTSWFIGGDLARAMGWLGHPAFGHLYADTVWREIAAGAGLERYRPEIRFKHLRLQDETFRSRSIAGDRERFLELRQSGAIRALVQRARAL